jgi:hypothetical protein
MTINYNAEIAKLEEVLCRSLTSDEHAKVLAWLQTSIAAALAASQ